MAIILRLFYWQVIRKDELTIKAEGQRFENVETGATRGDIFFSDNFLLAASKPTFLLYGLPKVLNQEQKVTLALKIAKLSPQEEQEEIKKNILDQLSKDLYWVPLKRDLDITLKKEIENLKLPGIGFESSSERFYPEGSSSAHLLGFVGSDSRGESTGYFGIEGYYNGELKGVMGRIRQEKDALGLPILIGRILGNNPKNGKNLVLNIDRSVQYTIEKALQEGQERYGAKAASAVVMDPKTGAILGLAAYPNYDPYSYEKFPKEFYKNPIVADSYEPGSTFKVLVVAAALNEALIKPDTKCDMCEGSVNLGGFTIRTWNNKYYPDSTMSDVIIHSDNTGMVFVGQKLGLDKFYSYLENFGFGSLTDIDLQDESSPELRPKKDWREIDLATASFGQGIAVTPIEMITAISSIANWGNLMEPHIVSEIKDENSSFEIKPKIIRQVVSREAAKTVTEMMVKAVDEGEAQFYKKKAGLENFKIAGKTGTAQIPVAGHYDPNKTIASFVGFAPADNPKFVILVRYDQPSASIFGAETAAPTFFSIAKSLFTYYKIAPNE